ncbi:DUF4351 domain-containing protein [Accumulibacter sp.]|uniref:DUF4351 domain-containing protein n=1 Tax=Accumulibacter sp. TaxID=2053492 RepID=UPI0025CE5B11|nr:DUF4351 domain-containing protein [Accumulibacter sp.]MCM8624891.1 DUF4351 domain-containing protein [Accumulibacter sp.]
MLGCRHHLHFPIVKLSELSEDAENLAANPNPFALVTAAYRRARQTRHDAEARYLAKRHLVRLLYRHGWERQRILDLFAVLDWMMRLPDALEQKLWKDIEEIEGETRMPYVTSVERLAKQRGMEEGLQQGTEQGERIGEAKVVERQLTRRFGPLDAETRARLQAATLEQLDRYADRLLDAATLDEVFSDS